MFATHAYYVVHYAYFLITVDSCQPDNATCVTEVRIPHDIVMLYLRVALCFSPALCGIAQLLNFKSAFKQLYS